MATRPCWHCAYFGKWITKRYEAASGYYSIAVCGRDNTTMSTPESGCARFSREPGADDETYCVDPAGKRREPT